VPEADQAGAQGEKEAEGDEEREPFGVGGHRAPPEAREHDWAGGPDENDGRAVAEAAQGSVALGGSERATAL
jgi:hypothetical protein